MDAAIADHLGWRMVLTLDGPRWFRPTIGAEPTKYLPEFSSDLNEMHEAEIELLRRSTEDHGITWSEYRHHLGKIAGEFTAIVARPEERAEAFLKAVGRWED